MIYETGQFTVCTECLQWLANGDATSLDHYYDQDTAAARLEAIQYGERQLVQEYGQIHIGDTESESESWSNRPCDCCTMTDKGARYPIATYTAAAGRTVPGWSDNDAPITYAADPFILSAEIVETEWQTKGLSYTASGYGAKIPTRYMVHCADNRTRRVYCRIYSNSGSLYILHKGQPLLLDQDAESKLEKARDTEQGEM